MLRHRVTLSTPTIADTTYSKARSQIQRAERVIAEIGPNTNRLRSNLPTGWEQARLVQQDTENRQPAEGGCWFREGSREKRTRNEVLFHVHNTAGCFQISTLQRNECALQQPPKVVSEAGGRPSQGEIGAHAAAARVVRSRVSSKLTFSSAAAGANTIFRI